MGVVKGSLKEQYTVINTTRNHNWIMDEPIERNGLNLGPTPVESLLSSLIGCKIITVKMYADRKGWSVKNVEVELSLGDKIDSKTIIYKSIRFEGDLDSDQIKRLTEISGRCPVAKLLANSFEFILQ